MSKVDVSAWPQVFDGLHLGLAAVVIVLLILVIVRRSNSDNTDAATDQAAPQPVAVDPAPAPEPTLKETDPTSALQLLSALQQEGRLIDFLQEDLTGFSDEEVGAVARVLHEGSKKALAQYVNVTPIRDEEEETAVTIESGFDASSVRLTGQVSGQAPYKGTLVHRGWRADKITMPSVASGHDASVIQPAEVEL